MNAAWAVFLGAGGAAGLLSFFYTVYKDVRGRHLQEKKAEGEVKLDSATETRIAAEAAQINSDVAIAQQKWWKDQFDAVRQELTEEQQLRRRLTQWAQSHQIWDRRAWELALHADPEYPPPPELNSFDGLA
jgi:hypothetical protein